MVVIVDPIISLVPKLPKSVIHNNKAGCLNWSILKGATNDINDGLGID